jgi:hypothetical protein
VQNKDYKHQEWQWFNIQVFIMLAMFFAKTCSVITAQGQCLQCPSTITMSTIKVFLTSKSIALGDAHNPSGKERNLICCWNSSFL